MSTETVERIYTINLGKVLLSPNNQRAKRAINMIRAFATKHMKSENVKIEEEISHLVWERGIRHPPRKIRVKLSKDDDGNIIVSKYQEEKKAGESKSKKEEKKAEEKHKKEEKKVVEEKPKSEEKKVEEKVVEEKPKKEEKKTEEKKTEEKKAEEKPKSEEKKAEEKPKKEKSEEKKSTESKPKKAKE